MTYDPSRIRPTRHRLLLSTTPVIPTSSPYFPGFEDPPPDYHPLEVPQYFRKRLIAFLSGRHPIPPQFLQSTIPISEVREVRKIWRYMLASGLSPGEALFSLGLLSRPYSSVPTHLIGAILASNCTCSTEPETTHVLILASAGDPLSPPHRIIRCSEVICEASPQTHAEALASSARADSARRAAFLARRAAV